MSTNTTSKTPAKSSTRAPGSTRPRASERATLALRAVIYLRISEDTEGEGKGVKRQLEDATAICDDEGWIVTEVITDNDRGASQYSKGEREGWLHLLDVVRAGEVDVVVIYNSDRLTRKPAELEVLIGAADRNRLLIRSIEGFHDLSASGGRREARAACTAAAYETDRMSERVTRKLRANAAEGKPHWPRRPFGYTMQAEVVPAEAALVREMYQRAIEGQSATVIAKWLNDAGHRSTLGNFWKQSTVTHLLTSPRNAGLREYKGEIVGAAQWDAIVSEEILRSAVANIDARRYGPRGGGKVLMLTGLLRCSDCGKSMVRSASKRQVVYRCTRLQDGSTASGCGNAATAQYVDDEIREGVLHYFSEVHRGQTVDTGLRIDTVNSLRADITELSAMFGNGELTLAAFQAAHKPLQERLRVAEGALARQDRDAVLAQLVGAGKSLPEAWDKLDPALQNRMIGTAAARIEIRRGQRGRKFDPARVVVEWN